MSFVTDQVRRIDALLDRLQLSRPTTPSADDEEAQAVRSELVEDRERIVQLQFLIKLISPPPSAKSALVPLYLVRSALSQSRLTQSRSILTPGIQSREGGEHGEAQDTSSPYERDLEWVLMSKATTQIYGQLLNLILEQTIPLSYDIDYWDSVLNSYRYSALYSIQTSPLRLWDFGQEVYRDVRQRAGVQGITEGVEGSWRQFYALVRDVVRERSVEDVRRRVVSPLARVRTECRKKRDALRRIRSMNANALGVLLGEGLSNRTMHEKGIATPMTPEFGVSDEDFDERRDKWRGTIVKSIALMDAVLANVNEEGMTVDAFDPAVGAATDDDRFYRSSDASISSLGPQEVAERLHLLLETRLPNYQASFEEQVKIHGRPSRLIRYWFPATVLLLSSGTILRILVNRKEEILTWVRDFGVTVRDFWANWVVEPARKIIGTIRHDEGSEISIMSKRSLEGDRESLERMVVDFAVQHPENGSLNEAQIADIRSKVKEGDLTPVLKAYEKDMQSPFFGVVRGNLIRTLLIQVQKTKVDVEVAMGGVDELLKSQELLFGFIGLTPGLLVCIGTIRWLNSTFGNRKTTQSGRQTGKLLHGIRNIDRVLTSAIPTDFGELMYKDQGLLLCDVHLLRQDAGKVMPKQIYRDFLEDVDELVDVRIGVKKQQKIVKRIRWAYAKWIQ
ncbi:NCA2-domain-containing protein [Rhizodiscina lignyota]|uniref:NCA2-domain-containing protein n=1 Tax=Rhizodiscina lignyota TaxID=1504668 RepID=A0A9P4M4W9_9PEZI|nr:NCA2-domain-containing protein [Rhizodiscina lignyota]